MKLHEKIQVTAELLGRPLSDLAVGVMARELAGYPEAEVHDALDRCMREGARGLTLAEITSRLPGAHLCVDEAWAIAERSYDETDSVVWTSEIAGAFGVVRHMDDRIAARLAFKAAYRRLVSDSQGRPTWNLSAGTDSMTRAAAVHDAIAAGRLPKGAQKKLLGAGPAPPKALPAPSTSGPVQVGDMRAFVEKLKLKRDRGEP